MWIPAVSTVIVAKFITKEGFGGTNLRIGALKPYALSFVVIPATFAIIYALTWLVGLATPDWQLHSLHQALVARGVDTAKIANIDSRRLLFAIFLASLGLGPVVNGLFGFGEELGWRGYLLPKLRPAHNGWFQLSRVSCAWSVCHDWHDHGVRYLHQRDDASVQELNSRCVDTRGFQWPVLRCLAHSLFRGSPALGRDHRLSGNIGLGYCRHGCGR
jgi:hypothetical protein